LIYVSQDFGQELLVGVKEKVAVEQERRAGRRLGILRLKLRSLDMKT
jgi:hypothetical protein